MNSTPNQSTGLSITNLQVGYGSGVVIPELSLELPVGSATLLTGRNGVGKSTLFRALMALIPADRGHVQWQGQTLLDRSSSSISLSTQQIARAGLGYVPEDRRIFADLTVAENLASGLKDGPGPRWDVPSLLDLLPPLKPLMDRRGGLLSGGEQQMLSLARTLMGSPSLILLDEPSEGLAPVLLDGIAEAIKQLLTRQRDSEEKGITLLIAEQNWQFAQHFVERVLVMDQGRIAHDAAMADFAKDSQSQQQWLGVQ